jgi:integrase
MAVTIRDYYSKRLKKKTFGYEIEVLFDGTRHFENKKGFKTRTEAKEVGKARELEIKDKTNKGHDIEQIINKDKSKLKLSELFQLWLNAKKSAISPKTYEFYNYCCIVILRNLGDLLISKLKTEEIELMINKLREAESSPSTIRHYYNTLNIAFNWAIDRNYMAINPCTKIQTPKKSTKAMMVYDEGQLKRLLDRVENMTCYIPIMLAATTGMRLGEICGLRWENINLKEKFLEVKEQLQAVEGTLKLLPLKTASSKRKIILLDYTIEALKVL